MPVGSPIGHAKGIICLSSPESPLLVVPLQTAKCTDIAVILKRTLQSWSAKDRHSNLGAVPELLPQLPATFGSHRVFRLVQDRDRFWDVAAHVLLGGSQAGDDPTNEARDAVRAGCIGLHAREFSCRDDLEDDEPHGPA